MHYNYKEKEISYPGREVRHNYTFWILIIKMGSRITFWFSTQRNMHCTHYSYYFTFFVKRKENITNYYKTGIPSALHVYFIYVCRYTYLLFSAVMYNAYISNSNTLIFYGFIIIMCFILMESIVKSKIRKKYNPFIIRMKNEIMVTINYQRHEV
jgi:hypothetical protein